MERYFILDKFNTWYDLHLIVTSKSIPDAEPKTNYVTLDGSSGSLDLSEALTGEITYSDRTLTATFWTDYGNRKDREALLRKISASLHGKKVKIVEPDDPTHYFYGRIKIKSKVNNLAYAEFTIEAICDPWRYALEDTVRYITATSAGADYVFNNHGVKTLCPTITTDGMVIVFCDNKPYPLQAGSHKISDLKFKTGSTVVRIIAPSGSPSVIFSYKEADL